MIVRLIVTALVSLTIFAGLSACGEVDQTSKTKKVYAGKQYQHAYDNKLFGNDKQKWETALAQRTRTQNDYLRMDKK